MKKLLTLVLCWLIAFSAMAETTLKASSALSAAGGYITSQNKVDGSFEDGITSWNASVGTIVKTASTEIQGNNIGVWSGTGAGTLDLQWTASATNTYTASAQVKLDVPADYSFCVVVNSVETGCKSLASYTANKIYKLQVDAGSVIGTGFYLRLKHTGSGAFSAIVDDGKIEPQSFQNVQVVEQESVTFKGTGLLSTTGTIRFPTTGFNKQWANLATYDQNTGRITAKRRAVFSGGITLAVNNPANSFYIKKNGAFVTPSSHTPNGVDYLATAPFSIELAAGDYLSFDTEGVVNITQSSLNSFSITATAISDNVIQAYQDGTEWTSYAPTFNGFGTPTGVDFKWKKDGSDMLISGYFITGASTAVLPYFTLPSGFSPVPVSVLKMVGFSQVGAGSNTGYTNTAQLYVEPSSGNPRILFQKTTSAALDYQTDASAFASAGQKFTLFARIPIQGWSSSPTLIALPTRSEVFSSSISASGVASNATQNFVTSCTNATPSVCSLWASFGVAPICWSHTLDITKRAEVTATTATTATVARTDTATAFNLFCHLK